MLNKCSYKTQEKLTDFLPKMPIEKYIKKDFSPSRSTFALKIYFWHNTKNNLQ